MDAQKLHLKSEIIKDVQDISNWYFEKVRKCKSFNRVHHADIKCMNSDCWYDGNYDRLNGYTGSYIFTPETWIYNDKNKNPDKHRADFDEDEIVLCDVCGLNEPMGVLDDAISIIDKSFHYSSQPSGNTSSDNDTNAS